jgi:hypothetical protein
MVIIRTYTVKNMVFKNSVTCFDLSACGPQNKLQLFGDKQTMVLIKIKLMLPNATVFR